MGSPIYSATGYCRCWGQAWADRTVSGLTREERAAVDRGEEVRITGCPPFVGGHHGTTERTVIRGRDGGYYARVPREAWEEEDARWAARQQPD